MRREVRRSPRRAAHGQIRRRRDHHEAVRRAKPERERGLSHSFDMLGEAARTYADAGRYFASYKAALQRFGGKRTPAPSCHSASVVFCGWPW